MDAVSECPVMKVAKNFHRMVWICLLVGALTYFGFAASKFMNGFVANEVKTRVLYDRNNSLEV